MGHPSFIFPASFNPCGEIPLGLPVLPYPYWIRHLEENQIESFIVSEVKNRPEYVDQLKQALESFPQYRKYIKLLVLA